MAVTPLILMFRVVPGGGGPGPRARSPSLMKIGPKKMSSMVMPEMLTLSYFPRPLSPAPSRSNVEMTVRYRDVGEPPVGLSAELDPPVQGTAESCRLVPSRHVPTR